MSRQELARQIYSVSHLTGIFKLRSGKTSTEYFDKYMFESDPKILSSIVDHMIPLLPKKIEVLAGLELGGIPLATALSLKTGLPAVFVRKKAKEYGTEKVVEGVDVKGKQVCMIEDVVTTGGQIILSARDLRNLGAIVSDVLCVIVRENSAFQNLANEALILGQLFKMEELQ
ncbi:MAG: orotate phosphoribosyltransferase [Thaumarchaeota archaeon]|nr:orotate phosphoribosyltransferase [Nitrososphaerota archaeon]